MSASIHPQRRFRSADHIGGRRTAVRVSEHQVRRRVAPHDHDFLELVLVTAGTARHRTIYGDRDLAAGDLLVLPPRVCHAYERCRDLTVWNCLIGPELLGRELAWAAEDPLLGPLLGPPPADRRDRGIIELRLAPADQRQLVAQLDALRTGDDHARQVGRLLMMLARLGELLAIRYPATDLTLPPIHPAVRKVREAIEHRLDHAWTLDELAALSGVNASYLARLCRQRLGVSPIAYLNRRRAERAAGLLLTTDWPVSRIGLEVGWSDPNYFARRFRMQFGRSPTAYRAEGRQA